MSVLQQLRRQRVGYALLLKVEEFAAASGCRRLHLSTTPFLARAIRLYEEYGFRRIDEGPHDLFGTPLFTMEKSLSHDPVQRKQQHVPYVVSHQLETIAVHAGAAIDPETGAVAPPIHLSTTF